MSVLFGRHTVFTLCILASIVGLILVQYRAVWWWLTGPALVLTAIGIYDLLQKKHAVRRNYPVIGNMRYLVESVRPELRQYLFEDDNEAQPFSRVQRAMVYQRAKHVMDKRPFGTQRDVYESRHEWINHSLHPSHIADADFRITVGGPECTQPVSLSVLNISAMSFGALSANAIMALNRGAKAGGFAHDTGEGGISRYHKEGGGDLIWNIGSGYFGCRDENGHFSPERFAEQAALPQVRMIELKLSQGAKPGHGGILPGPKVTLEIAEARGVAPWQDCNSPSRHSAFDTPIEMMHFIRRLRELAQGKPVGFKMCIGHPWEWFAIVKAMLETDITPDFIVVDGAEGGTGAAPLELVDHVGMPLREALWLVHNTLIGVNLRDRIRIGAAGKIVSAFDMARTFALGADWCNSARAFMMAVGCIQAQSCHTGRCPTGVATQDPARQRALVVPDKAERVEQFHHNTLRALQELLEAAGLMHPDDLSTNHVVRRVSPLEIRLLATLFPSVQPGALLKEDGTDLQIFRVVWPMARADTFAPSYRLDEGMLREGGNWRGVA